MAGKIFKLVKPTALEVDQQLVSRLEQILEMARAGELQSFSAVGILVGGDMLTSLGPTPDPWGDVGALEVLKQRLIQRDFECSE